MLAEMQAAFAKALLNGAMPPISFAPGPIDPAEAIRVHRNTVLGGAVSALRLAFPTVEKLVGEDFFDSCAADFVRAHPPSGPRLSLYGADFPGWLAMHLHLHGLAYLADVARLDWALDQAVRAPLATRRFMLDDTVMLEFPVHLVVLQCAHDVAAIRTAVENGENDVPAAVDVKGGMHGCAIWRDGPAARLRPLRPESLVFLQVLLTGVTPAAALAASAGEGSSASALAAIQADIFAASFCRIIPLEENQP